MSSNQKKRRFESMSWLYRDTLSDAAASAKRLPSKAAKQAQPEGTTPQTTDRTPTIRLANEKDSGTLKPHAKNDRFASMSWLYRDNIPGYRLTKTGKKTTEHTNQHTASDDDSHTATGDKDTAKSTAQERHEEHDGETAEGQSYEAMRWLYDDETSFRKAVAELKKEQANEEQKRELKREARRARARRLRAAGEHTVQWCQEHVRKHPRRYIAGAVGVGVFLLLLVGAQTFVGGPQDQPPQVAGVGTKAQKAPPFDTVLPKNSAKNADAPMVYDEQRKVANFADSIGAVRIIVSEQPLPDRFKVNQAVELEKFAKEINCNQALQAGGTQAFLGTSVKGPQTVVMIKKDLLIFIKADATIPNSSWMTYIQELV